MHGYDSPELRPSRSKDYSLSRFASREAEIKDAEVARDYLAGLILEKPVQLEIIPDDDKYGRLLCRVYADGRCINDDMVHSGNGYPYDGGTKVQ